MINHKIQVPKLTKQFRRATYCTYFSERKTPLGRCLASAINLCLQISGSDALCLSSVLVLLMLRKHFLKVDMIKQFCCIQGTTVLYLLVVERNHHLEIWWYGPKTRFRLSRYIEHMSKMRFKKDSFPTLCTALDANIIENPMMKPSNLKCSILTVRIPVLSLGASHEMGQGRPRTPFSNSYKTRPASKKKTLTSDLWVGPESYWSGPSPWWYVSQPLYCLKSYGSLPTE